MKLVLGEILEIVPMRFEQVDAIVEEERVALMVESHADLPDGGRYNNVYTFITTLHPDRSASLASENTWTLSTLQRRSFLRYSPQ